MGFPIRALGWGRWARGYSCSDMSGRSGSHGISVAPSIFRRLFLMQTIYIFFPFSLPLETTHEFSPFHDCMACIRPTLPRSLASPIKKHVLRLFRFLFGIFRSVFLLSLTIALIFAIICYYCSHLCVCLSCVFLPSFTVTAITIDILIHYSLIPSLIFSLLPRIQY